MWLTLIILGILALFILFQLYNVLGRRVGFKADEQPVTVKPDEVLEALPRIEKKPEGMKIPNLELLKTRDASFNELNFIEKSRETYESVVLAFNRGELDNVKDRLAEPVYKVFSDAIAAREDEAPQPVVSFVDTPKADYDNIEIREDTAVIRMRFLSEILYQEPTASTTAETAEVAAHPELKHEPLKAYKRTAEYWTFQKVLKSPGQPWILAKVEAAKA